MVLEEQTPECMQLANQQTFTLICILIKKKDLKFLNRLIFFYKKKILIFYIFRQKKKTSMLDLAPKRGI